MPANQQRRHYPSAQRTSTGSMDSLQSSSSPVHANFSKAPGSTAARTGSESPYIVSAGAGRRLPSVVPSISEKFSLSPDPAAWGADLSIDYPEPDDALHNPDPKRGHKGDIFTVRGLTNLGCLIILGAGLLTLFGGYPLISHFTTRPLSFLGGFNVGGINATGQARLVPEMIGGWGLIDKDTPANARTLNSYHSPGKEMRLVFSDEFNTDGRTFYPGKPTGVFDGADLTDENPGDDPYWEAVDLHYWATNNLEWYDPSAAITKDGALVLTLSKTPTHDLNYMGGLISTWNKFCFTGGLIVTAVSLPGTNNVHGLWPAIWTMGNLGRAGYGASLEGMWPYTYDDCDVGTTPNQTVKGLPLAATVNGDKNNPAALSFLPGQKLSRCTCLGESHPGPIHSDGSYVGRAAPEIDVFEAQVSNSQGQVSQSAQWAPFNNEYVWFNTSENLVIPDPSIAYLNSYRGGQFQQATSVVVSTGQKCYQLLDSTCYEIYGFEYQPGFDGAYISWISNNKLSWTFNQGGAAADPVVEISARPIPQEPMYIIANLGISENFGTVDFENLIFPAIMKVDYIRVYQPGFPTSAYIDEYIDAYMNPNLTTWVDDYKQPFPKNKLVEQC
ncbi:glycoside hydrolase family 16 protein [Mycena rebaudengoi]|nr:glycoside hydrolase family 16 protein [Mycena rebaudengoi]